MFTFKSYITVVCGAFLLSVSVQLITALYCVEEAQGRFMFASVNKTAKNITCDSRAKFCLRMNVTGLGTDGTARGCDGAMPLSPSKGLLCKKVECGYTKQLGFAIRYCCCSGDYCNGEVIPASTTLARTSETKPMTSTSKPKPATSTPLSPSTPVATSIPTTPGTTPTKSTAAETTTDRSRTGTVTTDSGVSSQWRSGSILLWSFALFELL
ncbi:hypothetical protein AB6A40_011132 [Gnathostoma spinigerum]|uniref:Uncharacterized protein n=1 Tax=Gnathostoma spinigerum TaxID=75299 RepID=A0ABD6EXB5_9BILA